MRNGFPWKLINKLHLLLVIAPGRELKLTQNILLVKGRVREVGEVTHKFQKWSEFIKRCLFDRSCYQICDASIRSEIGALSSRMKTVVEKKEILFYSILFHGSTALIWERNDVSQFWHHHRAHCANTFKTRYRRNFSVGMLDTLSSRHCRLENSTNRILAPRRLYRREEIV